MSYTERRTFLNGFHAAGAAFAALVLGKTASAQKPAAKAAPAKFEAPRHDVDAWMEQIPGKHRMLFDTTGPEGVRNAITFSGNFIQVNEIDYGLKDGSAVIFVMRFRSVSYGYNDTIWAKYGQQFSTQLRLEDPKTKSAYKVNPANTGPALDNLGRAATLESLAKVGVRFAICNTATKNMSRNLARGTGGDPDAIYEELKANLITEGRIVPAGIVAVCRAQERGYTLAQAG